MSIEIKYALKHKKTKEIVGYYTSPNNGGDCCDNEYILSLGEDNKWYVDSPEHAEWVKQNSTEWYNAGYDTPNHNFKAADLAVVKVTIEIHEEELDIKLPSFEEYATYKKILYNNENDYIYRMEQKKKHPEMMYSLYDLKEMLKNKKEK